MRRVLLLGVLLGVLPAAAIAQDVTPTPPPAVSVDYGPYTLKVDGEEPVVTCVLEARSSLDSREFTGVVFVRNLDGDYYPLGTFESRATAAFAKVGAGDCVP